MKITRDIGILLVLCVIVSFALGVTWSSSGTFVAGNAAVYDGADFVPNATATQGVKFTLDKNTVCFNGTACDINVDWNGTDIIING